MRADEKEETLKLKIMSIVKKRNSYGKVIPVNPLWVGKQDAMRLLCCGENFLAKLRQNGDLCFAQSGKKVWYEVLSINRYIERHRVL
jgi:hypothetical protein